MPAHVGLTDPEVFEEPAMMNSTQPFAGTVVPSLGNDTSAQAIASGEHAPPVANMSEVFVSTPRRIVHAAIRIGKHFEFVVECCVL
jgi:hypothetical protein